MLGITILGNNSAVPAFDRHPTSQLIVLPGHAFLVDCGEGTQIQMMRYKVRRNKISHIFISHLHGDHYFGLVGLISSWALLGRLQDLHIFAPKGLQTIIELQLQLAHTELPYRLFFHTITEATTLLTFNDVTVRCFKTLHRIECYGFVFTENKKPRKIQAAKVKAHGIPATCFEALQNGEHYMRPDGTLIYNEELTIAAATAKTYAYCADTQYDESILPHIGGATMIYHEATYLNNLADRAALRFHSTAGQAATIAAKAGVQKLLIGHFSSKYDALDEFLTEAQAVFPNTALATEGTSFRLL